MNLAHQIIHIYTCYSPDLCGKFYKNKTLKAVIYNDPSKTTSKTLNV